MYLKYVKPHLLLPDCIFYKTELASLRLRENFINKKIGEKAVYLFICAACYQIFSIIMFCRTVTG